MIKQRFLVDFFLPHKLKLSPVTESIHLSCIICYFSISLSFLFQCEEIKGELVELQGLYESSQRERAELEAELQRCRAELDRLAGRKAQVRGHKGASIKTHYFLPKGFGMCGLPWGKNVTSNNSLYCTHAENKQTLLTQQVGRDIINRMTPWLHRSTCLSAFENALYMTNVLHVGSTTAEVTVCPTAAPVFQSASCLTKPLRHFRSSMYVSLWVAFCPVTHIDSGLRVFSHLVFVKPLAANVFC